MRSFRRVALRLSLALLLLIATGLVGAGWYYSNEIERGALAVLSEQDGSLDLEVVEVEDASIRLISSGGGNPAATGTWGLEWSGGYGRVREVLSTSPGEARRRFEHVIGNEPRPGQAARLDAYAFPADPSSVGSHEDVTFANELGTFPAWMIRGDDRWLVYAHGRGATRAEGLRLASVVADDGYSVLLPTYRNDVDAPVAPAGRYGFGRDEWRDLDAAVQYALESGADRVVLAGSSMGGAIIAAFLDSSDLAAQVDAVILDSPALDLGAIVEHEATERDLPVIGAVPRVVTAIAKWLTSVRFDVDWSRIDYISRSGDLDVPVLLFHGTEDGVVPISLSEDFARRHPRLVRFVRCTSTGHVECWNRHPARYERAVDGFLADHVEDPRAGAVGVAG